ncbi:response regulator [Saccharicrinis sp. FJH54]|uniref:hybrid sensor histidine kinase/response regulator n=1 Tax=Saccharicrinis sp. FJH54 TaxID=3344665 RepID=UPI0035D3EAF3
MEIINEYQRILGLKPKIDPQDYIVILETLLNKMVGDSRSSRVESMTYYTLFQKAPVVYLVLNETYRILDVNHKGIDLLGKTKENLRSALFTDYIVPDYKEIFNYYMEQVRSMSDLGFCEVKLKSADGKALFVRILGKFNHNDTDGNEFWLNIVDVNSQKEYESKILSERDKARQSDLHKSTFLADMSHEIRTSMNSIIGFSNLLADRGISDEQKRNYLGTIKESGNQLLKTINDVIDLSKLDAGQLKINRAECNMIEICSYCYNVISNDPVKLQKKDVELRLNFTEKNRDINVFSDSERIKQILIYLLTNAVKFTDRGFIDFGFNIKHYDQKPFVEFYVKDTGCGIPTENLQQIFNRFYRAGNSEDQVGAGLGLSISKGLVELLGGDIYVSSKVNAGSVFSFAIPFVSGNTKKAEKTISDNAALNMEGMTIIIAEDDEASYLYLRELLSGFNASIERAKNGKELLKLTDTEEPALILLDINMPEMDGYEALIKLKSKKISSKIIVQTAYALSEEKQRFVNAGADGYISKPIIKKNILDLIARTMRGTN